MRSKHINNSAEKGQATIELCCCLLALCFVIIAILYFGGIGITSIKTLLNAREQAEQLASDATTGNIGGMAIQRWTYSTAKHSEKLELDIPFLANDRPHGGASNFSNDFFANPQDSERFGTSSVSGDKIYYQFMPINDFYTLNYDDMLLSGNIFDISKLLFSSGYLPPELAGGSEEFYTMYKTKNAEQLKRGIKKAGWFDFNNIKITDWISNRVAYPAFAPRPVSGVSIPDFSTK